MIGIPSKKYITKPEKLQIKFGKITVISHF